MGFFANLLGRSDDGSEYEAEDSEQVGTVQMVMPVLRDGMTLSVETLEGDEIFSGRITGYGDGGPALTLERLPGGLSFKILELGSAVQLRGCDENLTQFVLRGSVQESTRLVFKVKDVRLKPIPELRHNFRLRTNSVAVAAELYYCTDESHSNPEECVLRDISTGGVCFESEYLHAEDEVLKLRFKLEDYAAMEFKGEIIRVTEYAPGKFRYGFLFAQLGESEMTELTRTLYNLQVGNKQPWSRYGPGHW